MKTDTECFQEALEQWQEEHPSAIGTLPFELMISSEQSEVLRLAQKIKDGQHEKA